MRNGLSHQLSSLSCALGEAFYTGRTLVLPRAGLCSSKGHAARWVAGGSECLPWSALLDLRALSRVVPVTADAVGVPPNATVEVGRNFSSHALRIAFPCDRAGSPVLIRRHLKSNWFDSCVHRRLSRATRRSVVYTSSTPLKWRLQMALRLEEFSSTFGTKWRLLDMLASGLWYARPLKQAAAAIRRRLGGSYVWLHVRRGDRLQKSLGCAQGVDCAALTRPPAIRRALGLWVPDGSSAAVYVGSDEPPAFFAPLAAHYQLRFAENFTSLLGAAANNNLLYAVETLVSYGAAAFVDTYAYYHPACFPAGATPSAAIQSASSPSDGTQRAGTVLVGGCSPDSTALAESSRRNWVRVNGVVFGAGCAQLWRREGCARGMRLVPAPSRQCGVDVTSAALRQGAAIGACEQAATASIAELASLI
jgi:hypothetical protein